MNESQHQILLFFFARCWRETFREFRLLFSVPNGGFRSKVTASRMVAEGARAGVPDVCLPVARGGFHGLYIEMKKPAEGDKRKGVLSPEQREWIHELQAEGYKVVVCYGWEHAASELLEYVGE